MNEFPHSNNNLRKCKCILSCGNYFVYIDYTSIIYKWESVAYKQQEGIVHVYERIMA